MATTGLSKIIEMSSAQKQAMIENRQMLLESIPQLEIMVDADPSMKPILDKARDAFKRIDAVHTIMIKNDPAVKTLSDKS